MDKVARLSQAERSELFSETAVRKGMTPAIESILARLQALEDEINGMAS